MGRKDEGGPQVDFYSCQLWQSCKELSLPGTFYVKQQPNTAGMVLEIEVFGKKQECVLSVSHNSKDRCGNIIFMTKNRYIH